jgi:prophage regulatory protein
MTKRILRIRETESRVGLKKSAIYDLITKGEFPEPVPLGLRAHGWLESELEAWIDERAQQRRPSRWAGNRERVAA